MPPESQGIVREWFRLADRDLWRAHLHVREDDLGFAAFLIQQALEKALKGFLLSQGWELRKIHNLETLLNDAVLYDGSLEKWRPLVELATEYYFSERYPDVGLTPSLAPDVEEHLAAAENLLALLRSRAED